MGHSQQKVCQQDSCQIMYMKERLTHFTKGSRSTIDYLHGIKSMVDELAIINAPLGDVDLVIHTLNALGVKYKEVSIALLPR